MTDLTREFAAWVVENDGSGRAALTMCETTGSHLPAPHSIACWIQTLFLFEIFLPG